VTQVQLADTQAAFCPQAFLQLPQLFPSEARFTSQPLDQSLSQLAKPFLQTQLPLEQEAFCPQKFPQLPQLLLSELRFTSQPLDQEPSQLAKPL